MKTLNYNNLKAQWQKVIDAAGPDFKLWKPQDEFDICMLLDGYSPKQLQELRDLYF
jgi:hypothetical protein